jgi:hypothetical protein
MLKDGHDLYVSSRKTEATAVRALELRETGVIAKVDDLPFLGKFGQLPRPVENKIVGFDKVIINHFSIFLVF